MSLSFYHCFLHRNTYRDVSKQMELNLHKFNATHLAQNKERSGIITKVTNRKLMKKGMRVCVCMRKGRIIKRQEDRTERLENKPQFWGKRWARQTLCNPEMQNTTDFLCFESKKAASNGGMEGNLRVFWRFRGRMGLSACQHVARTAEKHSPAHAEVSAALPLYAFVCLWI